MELYYGQHDLVFSDFWFSLDTHLVLYGQNVLRLRVLHKIVAVHSMTSMESMCILRGTLQECDILSNGIATVGSEMETTSTGFHEKYDINLALCPSPKAP